MSISPPLPGGDALRPLPRGIVAGARRSTVHDARGALALVADELAQAEHTLRALVGSDVAALTTIAGYLADSGGKRLRPALTALGARAVGFTPVPNALLCCGELIHLGSLLHDDVVDQGDVRRGRPAAHVVYGNAVAVLTGDLCVGRALLAAITHGGAGPGAALAATVAEMSEGEVLQLQRAGDLDNSLENYFDIIDRKSASLIAWCAAAGAYAVGDDVAARALSGFGRGIGRAFQITDDVLDYQAGTDKLPGADLRERKVTLPLLFAMQRDPELRELLADGPPSPEDVPDLMARVRRTGALDAALQVAREHVQAAMSSLDALPPSEARDALAVLGRAVVERSS